MMEELKKLFKTNEEKIKELEKLEDELLERYDSIRCHISNLHLEASDIDEELEKITDSKLELRRKQREIGEKVSKIVLEEK